MAPIRSHTRHQTLYRALLKLYPRSFRDRFSEPMVQLFGDHFGQVGARAWLRTIPDLARTVPTERKEAVMAHISTGTRVLALAFIVLGATAVSIGVGGGVVPIVAVAVIAVLVTQGRLFASLPRGELAPLRHAVVQEWWAPVAALLGLAMVVGGIGTVFEAHNWGGRIFGSALLLAFGFGMLFGLMRRPFDRRTGNSLILVTTIPAFPFFWLIVPTVAAIVVWIGVLKAGFEDSPVTPAVS